MITNLVGSLMGIGMVGVAILLFRRELAHRLQAQDAGLQLAAIVESSDDAIVSKTLDGLIVELECGRQADLRLHGRRSDRPPNRLTMSHRTSRRNPKQLRPGSAGEHIEHFETIRVRKDGQRIDVSLRISPIKEVAGT